MTHDVLPPFERPCRRHLRLLIQAIQTRVVASPPQGLLSLLRLAKCLSIMNPKTATNTRNSYDESFMLDPFIDEEEFLKFLGLDPNRSVLNPPEPIPGVPSTGMGSFFELSKKLAEYIHHRCGYYLLFLYFAFLTTYDFT